MPVTVINVIVYENRCFSRIKHLDVFQQQGEFPIVMFDPGIRYRSFEREKYGRVQSHQNKQYPRACIFPIPFRELCPKENHGNRRNEKKSGEEYQYIARILDRDENEQIKEHTGKNPQREKNDLLPVKQP